MKLAEKYLKSFTLTESQEVEDFLNKLKAHYEQQYNKDMKHPDTHQTLNWKKGPKYYSVWSERINSDGGRSQYMFIDKEGNIYKSAGWGKPAKGIRGHVSKVDISKTDPHGGWLYRY
jgi:hypothetical protein